MTTNRQAMHLEILKKQPTNQTIQHTLRSFSYLLYTSLWGRTALIEFISIIEFILTAWVRKIRNCVRRKIDMAWRSEAAARCWLPTSCRVLNITGLINQSIKQKTVKVEEGKAYTESIVSVSCIPVRHSDRTVPVLFGVGVWFPSDATTGPTGKDEGRCSDLHNWAGSRA